MFKRVFVAGVCVAVLGATSLGAVASAAPAQGSSALQGRTAQGRRIRLALGRDSVEIKRFTVQLRCRGGDVLVDEESGFQPTPVKPGGRLHDDQLGSTDEVRLRGHLGGRRLQGAIRVTDRLAGARCDSRWVKFTASQRG
ncbi:MAG TPA: hypothetical protein VHU86_10500 [Solirubrobacterales bacterium]|jgi:hypothetical protein|nr:hypothetical protein [Solirubrobacterales bacterium]